MYHHPQLGVRHYATHAEESSGH